MRSIDIISLILVIIGGLNWLAVGLFETDIVAVIFQGQLSPLARIVYVIVGIAALWLILATPRLSPPPPRMPLQ